MIHDPEQQKNLINSSLYYRQSKAAWESGKMEQFFDLPIEDQAWIMAYMEESQLLEAVMSMVAMKNG